MIDSQIPRCFICKSEAGKNFSIITEHGLVCIRHRGVAERYSHRVKDQVLYLKRNNIREYTEIRKDIEESLGRKLNGDDRWIYGIYLE